jgi:hypothetical protein
MINLKRSSAPGAAMYESTVNSRMDETPVHRRTDWTLKVRQVLGTILVLAGVALAIWLAMTIYGLIWGEGVPTVVANLTPQSQEDVAIIFPGGEVVLAHKVFPVIAYVLTILLLTVGVALVKAMVAGGNALLPPSPQAEAPAKAPEQRDEEQATLEAHYNRGPL